MKNKVYAEQEIVDALKSKGLKKGFVAEAFDISQPLFSMYINGTRPMPADLRKKVLEFINE